jgi:hypothetical protein
MIQWRLWWCSWTFSVDTHLLWIEFLHVVHLLLFWNNMTFRNLRLFLSSGRKCEGEYSHLSQLETASVSHSVSDPERHSPSSEPSWNYPVSERNSEHYYKKTEVGFKGLGLQIHVREVLVRITTRGSGIPLDRLLRDNSTSVSKLAAICWVPLCSSTIF